MRSQRFAKNLDESMERLNASIDFDSRLYSEDIEGSLAWASALEASGFLNKEETASIREGLTAIRAEIEAGEFPFSRTLEDIHMNIESRLTERAGAAGEKLHTGRSRNDQVVTDLRLFVKRAAHSIAHELNELVLATAAVAEREIAVLSLIHI